MTEIELYKEFHKAWRALHALPNKKGAPSLEKKAAAEYLVQCAHRLESFVPDAKPTVSAEVANYRALNQAVLAVQPPIGQKPENARLMDRTPKHG